MWKTTTSIGWMLVLASLLCFSSVVHATERNWNFAVSGYGGQSFSEDVGVDVRCGSLCAAPNPPYWGVAHGVKKTDHPSWGAKFTGWYLHKNHDWQPQVGIELDWTRFITAEHAQATGGTGTTNQPGTQIGAFISTDRKDFSTNIIAINVLFRYPIGVSGSLPEGRWYPYVGVGGGLQRTAVTMSFNGVRQVDYSPEWQVLAGAKVFIFRNLAIFGEWKRTAATHTYTYGITDYSESVSIVSNHVTGGVSLHF